MLLLTGEIYALQSAYRLLLDKKIIPYVNQLIINNYCLDMKLHDNVQEIYDYAKAHPDELKGRVESET